MQDKRIRVLDGEEEQKVTAVVEEEQQAQVGNGGYEILGKAGVPNMLPGTACFIFLHQLPFDKCHVAFKPGPLDKLN